MVLTLRDIAANVVLIHTSPRAATEAPTRKYLVTRTHTNAAFLALDNFRGVRLHACVQMLFSILRSTEPYLDVYFSEAVNIDAELQEAGFTTVRVLVAPHLPLRVHIVKRCSSIARVSMAPMRSPCFQRARLAPAAVHILSGFNPLILLLNVFTFASGTKIRRDRPAHVCSWSQGRNLRFEGRFRAEGEGRHAPADAQGRRLDQDPLSILRELLSLTEQFACSPREACFPGIFQADAAQESRW